MTMLAREPTEEELTAEVEALLKEVDDALASDRWALLNTGREGAVWRIYDGATLRHCCLLQAELDAAASAKQELTVRILARVHIEAWFYGLYLHFGGVEALTRIAEDSQASLQATHEDLQQFDAWLRREKRRQTRHLRTVRQNNARNADWNAQHPDQPPRKLLDEPYVPQLAPTGIDLSNVLSARSGTAKPRPLRVSTLTSILTRMAAEQGFGRENFAPAYHIYRFLSAAGLHPTLDLLDSYIIQGNFNRIGNTPGDFSLMWAARITSLYLTAFLAEWVLSAAGSPTPVATRLRLRLQPTSEGGRPW